MGRTRAALAAAAVDDDSHQDEDHAGDTEHVRKVLAHGSVVRFVSPAAEVKHDVDEPRRDHHGQTDLGSARHPEQVVEECAHRFYHQHWLVIHPAARDVNSIANPSV